VREVIKPMNASDMLDYALGRLEGPDRDQAEREIADDPALAEALDRLGRAMHQLLDDGDAKATLEPPEGLALQTIAQVDEARRMRRRTMLDFMPASVPFRWTDLAVAAGILLASLLTLVPAVRCSKMRMDQAGCGLNLRQLGVSLAQYAIQHHHFPYAPPDHPDAASGCFAILLRDQGLLTDPATLDCPCNGMHARAAGLPSVNTLCELQHKSPGCVSRVLHCDYAYNLGCRDGSGHPRAIPARLSTSLPLLADQPPHEGFRILEGNSPNHGERGQNVLYSDGHVRWHSTRYVGPQDDDLFLNARHRPEPGDSIQDAVLVPSHFPFAR
jgi:hypothetical protein